MMSVSMNLWSDWNLQLSPRKESLKWCTLQSFPSFYWQVTKAGKRKRDTGNERKWDISMDMISEPAFRRNGSLLFSYLLYCRVWNLTDKSLKLQVSSMSTRVVKVHKNIASWIFSSLSYSTNTTRMRIMETGHLKCSQTIALLWACFQSLFINIMNLVYMARFFGDLWVFRKGQKSLSSYWEREHVRGTITKEAPSLFQGHELIPYSLWGRAWGGRLSLTAQGGPWWSWHLPAAPACPICRNLQCSFHRTAFSWS